MISYKLTVEGHVQGVGYRAFIYKHANKLNLKGFVKNMPDGSVLILLQGPENAVKELIELAYKGPPLSQVVNIKIKEEEREPFEDFHIA
jgi:acylphosphatase